MANDPASVLERHVHAEAYAALVLAGGYEEAGDRGRFRVEVGDVLFHEEFDGHLDRFPERGAVVLNLRLSGTVGVTAGVARIEDADALARLAERDCREAAELVCLAAMRENPAAMDWPDELAAALMEDPSLRLSRWGEANGIVPWEVSRGFSSVFGVSPEKFRARARTRQALNAIRGTRVPLASIAAEMGFADQSHMTRSVTQLTGIAPHAWRAANRFKTERKLVG